jgi:hypothetical protein
MMNWKIIFVIYIYIITLIYMICFEQVCGMALIVRKIL